MNDKELGKLKSILETGRFFFLFFSINYTNLQGTKDAKIKRQSQNKKYI